MNILKKIILFFLNLILYFLVIILNIKYFEIFYLKILIKFKNKKISTINKILLKNINNPKFAIYSESFERIKIFKNKFKDFRIDFGQDNYDKIINYNINLINKFPNQAILYDKLARSYIARGDKKNAQINYFKSLQIQRKDINEKNDIGLVVFISMPRSGTGFISNSLLKGLKIRDLRKKYKFSDSWFPDKAIFPFNEHLNSPYFIPMETGFVSGHAPAIDENLIFLSHLSDKIVINFRDPRQSVISWVHYMTYLQYTGNYSALLEYRLDKNYFSMTFENQLDWQIDHYFTDININWIKQWLEVKNNNYFNGEILYLNYEMLVDNMELYFKKILDFYKIPKSKFIFPRSPKFQNKSHMRKGDKNEWKNILSSEQIIKINNKIPEEWFKNYNWDINA